MIKVEHLAKSFGTLQVLKDISLSINKGEVVTIIGPSGSGKSTLLRCLNLLERPDSGKIIFDGTDILSGKVKIESIRKNACMVFQHFNLFANMTALQNVAYAPRVVNGLSRADAEAKAQKLLEKVGLGDKSGQYPQPTFRRAETARSHCPRHGHGTGSAAFGRTYLRARPGNGKKKCLTLLKGLPTPALPWYW